MQIGGEVFDARIIKGIIGVIRKNTQSFVAMLITGEIRSHSGRAVRNDAIQRRGSDEGGIRHVHGEMAPRLALVHAAQHDASASALRAAQAIAEHEDNLAHLGACALQRLHPELAGRTNGLPVGLCRFHFKQVVAGGFRSGNAPQGGHRRAGRQFFPQSGRGRLGFAADYRLAINQKLHSANGLPRIGRQRGLQIEKLPRQETRQHDAIATGSLGTAKEVRRRRKTHDFGSRSHRKSDNAQQQQAESLVEGFTEIHFRTPGTAARVGQSSCKRTSERRPSGSSRAPTASSPSTMRIPGMNGTTRPARGSGKRTVTTVGGKSSAAPSACSAKVTGREDSRKVPVCGASLRTM